MVTEHCEDPEGELLARAQPCRAEYSARNKPRPAFEHDAAHVRVERRHGRLYHLSARRHGGYRAQGRTPSRIAVNARQASRKGVPTAAISSRSRGSARCGAVEIDLYGCGAMIDSGCGEHVIHAGLSRMRTSRLRSGGLHVRLGPHATKRRPVDLQDGARSRAALCMRDACIRPTRAFAKRCGRRSPHRARFSLPNPGQSRRGRASEHRGPARGMLRRTRRARGDGRAARRECGARRPCRGSGRR